MALSFNYQETKITVGDTVRVHQEILEGKTKRVQVFEGIVIAIKNRGQGKSFTVRKIGANSIGVEKIMPVLLPAIKKIEVIRKGRVRRAKLYYLRNKIGRAATRVKEHKTFFNQFNPEAESPTAADAQPVKIAKKAAPAAKAKKAVSDTPAAKTASSDAKKTTVKPATSAKTK